MLNIDKKAILCVDDEPAIVDGLAMQLGRTYKVHTANSGQEGLDTLMSHESITVVISDMRMPGMNGAEFLGKVKQLRPEITRILLTGFTDIESAIEAVNSGQIFRFLTKPCPPDILKSAIAAGVEQHRLITAEKVLLNQTLTGSIKALTDTLALANPTVFGRASRIKKRVHDLATYLEIPADQHWSIEVAAQLSQIGCITLPDETAEKVYFGSKLDEKEQAMVERLPQVSERLLSHIPRLESVREIIVNQDKLYSNSVSPDNSSDNETPVGSQLLRVALDFDILETQGKNGMKAIDIMRERKGIYNPKVLEAFAKLAGSTLQNPTTQKVNVKNLKPGMVFAEDVVANSGSLLVAHGHEVTQGLLERLNNLPPGRVKEPILVNVSYLSKPQ